MSKIKYSEELKQVIIKMRLEGKTSPEIETATGMGKPSQTKLFRERGIKLNPEQKYAATSGSRWKSHQPIVEGRKKCAECQQMKSAEEFYKTAHTKTGLTSYCKACEKAAYEANPEPIRKRSREVRRANKDAFSERDSKYYAKNVEVYVKRAKEWDKANPDKRKAITKSYGKKNQKAKNGRTAHYRAKKIQATPIWLTEIDLAAMASMYENCPKGYHVDHIVPLRGDDVCGLHVPWNLQLLPGVENMSKGNKIVLDQVSKPHKKSS